MTNTVIKTLKKGVSLHQGGHPEEAARFYADVLDHDPRASDAWHLMGRVFLGRKQTTDAAACVAKAIDLRPDVAAFHATLGDVLVAQKRLHEAGLCYEEAVRRDPRFTPALVNLGNLLQDQGRFQDAMAAFVKALEADPNCAEALNNAGNSLLALGKSQEAFECYREALRLEPESAEAPVNMAALYLRSDQAELAEEWARHAVNLRPDLTHAVANLAVALIHQDRAAEAESLLRDAIRRAPGFVALYSNLASALIELKKWDEAEQACRRALELQPAYPEASLNLGVVFERSGRLGEAALEYQNALRARPDYTNAWANLGTVRQMQGSYADAQECFARALRLDPDHAKTHLCRSMSILADGRFEEGFSEYDWRWKTLREKRRALARPEWNGEDLGGRTILISAEQGLGDSLHFARYAPMVAERGGRVIIEAQPAAVEVLRTVPGVAEVIGAEDPLPETDFRIDMMSLPRVFGTRLDSIPNRVPYLACDRALAAELEGKLGMRRAARIGLAWSGNPLNGSDRRRSMPPESLLPLRDVAGVEWLSLHIGERAHEQVSACGGWVREVLSETGGLRELAALMSCLDLVVTVDSMPAHMAGALATPVWTLLYYAPDWRWMKGREDTPWYPTMRLFRQTQPGDWKGVIERVVRELSHFSFQAAPTPSDTEH